MNWIRKRILEPSTWAGVSAGFTFYYIWSVLPDTLHSYAIMVAAIASAIAAFILEEGRE